MLDQLRNLGGRGKMRREKAAAEKLLTGARDHLAAYTLNLLMEHGTDHETASRRSLKLTHGNEKLAARGWTVELAVDRPELNQPSDLERVRREVKYDSNADLSERSLAIEFIKGSGPKATVIGNVLFRGAEADRGLVRIDTERKITKPDHIDALGSCISQAVIASGIEAPPYEPFVAKPASESVPALETIVADPLPVAQEVQ